MTRAGRASTTELVRDHMPALDGLRGIAVLLVLAHAFDLVSSPVSLDAVLGVGWIGVQLFFVLSGFLITGILLDTRDSPRYYKNFYTRRTLRIFPLYYMVLIVAFIIIPLDADPPAGHGSHQFWLWTYTNNFAAPFGKEEHAFPHFWSLAVEEQFYLVWPFIVKAVGRRGVTIIAPLAVIVAIGARIYAREHFGQQAAYMFTPCRMDALALGALAAAMVRMPATVFDKLAPIWLRIGGAAIVVIGLLAGKLDRTGGPMQLYGYTVIALGFALVLVGALDGSRILASKPLRRVGMYSYAMYVFHVPLHLFVGLPIVGADPSLPIALVYIVAMTAVTFGAAAVSYHFYERRFLLLKTRLAP
jgi:peptidoglycan/LPS O-acetylase OafA/YrhL